MDLERSPPYTRRYKGWTSISVTISIPEESSINQEVEAEGHKINIRTLESVGGTERILRKTVQERMFQEEFKIKLAKLMVKETFNSMWTAMNTDDRRKNYFSQPIVPCSKNLPTYYPYRPKVHILGCCLSYSFASIFPAVHYKPYPSFAYFLQVS
jgi:hypothetical protein